MLQFKIALRNVLRQKRRSILTVLTMSGGFALAAISIGWSDGTYSSIIDTLTRSRIGHIQIHHKGYLDRPSLYKNMQLSPELIESLMLDPEIEAWAPRLYAGGLASVEEKSAGVQIIGIDPARENAMTHFNKKITTGRPLAGKAAQEALLGQTFAKILKAQPGDSIVLVSQGADGSIANDIYLIVGLVDVGDEMSNRMNCYLHIEDAQTLLTLEGRVHEVALVVTSLKHVPDVVERLQSKLEPLNLDVHPWNEIARSFYNAMKVDQEGMWITIFVVILIVAVQVLNTVLMSVLERTREYGVLKAIGTRPTQIIRLVIYEVSILALLSLVVGSVVGLVVIYALSIHGITLSEGFTYGGIEFRTMAPEINARSFYIPAITVFISSLVVALFPALKAARIAPARAMRTH